jgi:hypothetical protein
VIPIFYGYLCSLKAEVVESEGAKWGGVDGDWSSPTASCRRCGHDWRTRRLWGWERFGGFGGIRF